MMIYKSVDCQSHTKSHTEQIGNSKTHVFSSLSFLDREISNPSASKVKNDIDTNHLPLSALYHDDREGVFYPLSPDEKLQTNNAYQ